MPKLDFSARNWPDQSAKWLRERPLRGYRFGSCHAQNLVILSGAKNPRISPLFFRRPGTEQHKQRPNSTKPNSQQGPRTPSVAPEPLKPEASASAAQTPTHLRRPLLQQRRRQVAGRLPRMHLQQPTKLLLGLSRARLKPRRFHEINVIPLVRHERSIFIPNPRHPRPSCPRRSSSPPVQAQRPSRPSYTRTRGRQHPRPPPSRPSSSPQTALQPRPAAYSVPAVAP